MQLRHYLLPNPVPRSFFHFPQGFIVRVSIWVIVSSKTNIYYPRRYATGVKFLCPYKRQLTILDFILSLQFFFSPSAEGGLQFEYHTFIVDRMDLVIIKFRREKMSSILLSSIQLMRQGLLSLESDEPNSQNNPNKINTKAKIRTIYKNRLIAERNFHRQTRFHIVSVDSNKMHEGAPSPEAIYRLPVQIQEHVRNAACLSCSQRSGAYGRENALGYECMNLAFLLATINTLQEYRLSNC